jgi:hypothetical protein
MTSIASQADEQRCWLLMKATFLWLVKSIDHLNLSVLELLDGNQIQYGFHLG